MNQKSISIFIKSAGVLLIVTAAAKLISSFGPARIEDHLDPFFVIRFRNFFRISGAIELVVAAICLFSANRKLQVGIIAVLSTNFLLYRIGLHWIGYNNLCHCLGNLTDALHISPHVADTAMKTVLAYLLIGSYYGLIYLSREVEQEKPERLSTPVA